MVKENKEYDIFISYSHADGKEEIERIKKDIIEDYSKFAPQAKELKIFIDHDIKRGNDWAGQIDEAITNSKLFLAILSPNYFKSDFCAYEMRRWKDKEIEDGILHQTSIPIYYIELEDSPFDNDDSKIKEAFIQQADPKPWYDKGRKALYEKHIRAKVTELCTTTINDKLTRERERENSPTNIIAYNRDFVGRIKELTELRNQYASHPRQIPVLHGPAGCGKTELAFVYSYAYAAEYPGGRYVIKAEGINSIPEAFVKLTEDETTSKALGISERIERLKQEKEQNAKKEQDKILTHEEIYKKAIIPALKAIDKQILIIIDNVDEPFDMFSRQEIDEQFAWRRDKKDGYIHIMATTRKNNILTTDGDYAYPLPIKDLEKKDALELFRKKKNFELIEPTEDTQDTEQLKNEERKAAEEIIEYVGGNAWALSMIAESLKAENMTYTKKLQEIKQLTPQQNEYKTDKQILEETGNKPEDITELLKQATETITKELQEPNNEKIAKQIALNLWNLSKVADSLKENADKTQEEKLEQIDNLPVRKQETKEVRTVKTRHGAISAEELLKPTLDMLTEEERVIADYAALLHPDYVYVQWLKGLYLKETEKTEEDWQDVIEKLQKMHIFSTEDAGGCARMHRLTRVVLRKEKRCVNRISDLVDFFVLCMQRASDKIYKENIDRKTIYPEMDCMVLTAISLLDLGAANELLKLIFAGKRNNMVLGIDVLSGRIISPFMVSINDCIHFMIKLFIKCFNYNIDTTIAQELLYRIFMRIGFSHKDETVLSFLHNEKLLNNIINVAPSGYGLRCKLDLTIEYTNFAELAGQHNGMKGLHNASWYSEKVKKLNETVPKCIDTSDMFKMRRGYCRLCPAEEAEEIIKNLIPMCAERSKNDADTIPFEVKGALRSIYERMGEFQKAQAVFDEILYEVKNNVILKAQCKDNENAYLKLAHWFAPSIFDVNNDVQEFIDSAVEHKNYREAVRLIDEQINLCKRYLEYHADNSITDVSENKNVSEKLDKYISKLASISREAIEYCRMTNNGCPFTDEELERHINNNLRLKITKLVELEVEKIRTVGVVLKLHELCATEKLEGRLYYKYFLDSKDEMLDVVKKMEAAITSKKIDTIKKTDTIIQLKSRLKEMLKTRFA